jgi:hypothetical protein
MKQCFQIFKNRSVVSAITTTRTFHPWRSQCQSQSKETKRITLTADRNHLTAAQKAASPRSTPRRFAKEGNRPPWDFTLLART